MRKTPTLRTTTKMAVILIELFLLIVQMGSMNLQTRLRLIANLAVNLLVGTTFMDRDIKGLVLRNGGKPSYIYYRY